MLKPLNSEPLDSTSWLSGFVEGNGHFRVRATHETPAAQHYAKVECVFEIEHAQTTYLCLSYKDCMLSIANLFKTTLKEIKLDTKHPKYRLKTSTLAGNLEVEKYFKNYPLFGKKYLDLID